ncbi:MAG: diguanylate cyclase [Clostridiales bacterium]|nr:diguanylate cyclase [Clostridiales bacterium]MBR5358112.1 diguanylate cyclase [Clostridiales bacterium]
MGIKKRGISLKIKFVGIILVMVVVLAATLGSLCYSVLGKVLDDDAAQNLNLTVRQYVLQVDNKLCRVEDAVQGVDAYVTGRLSSAYEISDPAIRDSFQQYIEQYFVTVAGNNNDVVACYMTFNPEITDSGTNGFYYCKADDGTMASADVTDVLKFSESENVWFYQPVEKQSALWLDPYYSPKSDMVVISYVLPVYIDDVLVGVVGIDMDFNKLIKYVSGFPVMDTGESYLKSNDGTVHYHLGFYEQGENAHGDKDVTVTENANKMTQATSDKYVIRYKFDGADKAMVFGTLENGMKLVIEADYAVAFSSRSVVLTWILVIGIIFCAVMVGVSYYYANRITRSLRELTDASHRIANGDLRVQIPDVDTNDEVADLTRSIKTVVNSLKTYTVDMETKAFVDQMTKVKNKSAFNSMVESIDEQIRDGVARFAVVMCDLNYLKVTNDKFGHSAGDDAITRAAHIICEHFPLSQVFRIGGDEFVVILTEHDFRIRQKLIYEFGEHLKQLDNNPHDIKNISLSYGASEFHAGEDPDFNAVFKRADERMYQMKQELHKKHGIGIR